MPRVRTGVLLHLAAASTVSLTSATEASPTFLATHGTTLYRWSPGGSIETFRMPDVIGSLARAPDGAIWATSPTAGPAGRELYRLARPLSSNPALDLHTDTLPRNYSAITFVGPDLYAFDADSRDLDRFSWPGPTRTPLGPTTTATIHAFGAAYNPVTRTIHLGINSREFYVMNFDPAPPPQPVAALTGRIGIPIVYGGLEWYDGILYGAFHRADDGRFVLGTLDPRLAHFTEFLTLDAAPLGGGVGLTVVPAPALFPLLMVIAARRRRL